MPQHPTQPRPAPTPTLRTRAPKRRLAHDANGNLTDDGANYKFKYDAFGRLRKVINRSTDADVAVYRYNGLGYRIMWQYDVDADATLENDERFYFAYDERWRMLATYRNADSDPKERFFYHLAGLAGMGGSSYIDSVVLRDRDNTNGWGGAADGTLEDRVYYAQNWRADVVATFKPGETGIVLHERIKYDSYGRPRWYYLEDYDHDGGTGIEDMLDYLDDFENIGDARVDTNFDGGVGIEDMLDYLDAYENPRGTDNRKLYAGNEWDFTTGYANGHYHVRHRVLLPELGRWSRRDPLGYVDGMSVYEYATSRPAVGTDHLGLSARADASFDLVSDIHHAMAATPNRRWPYPYTEIDYTPRGLPIVIGPPPFYPVFPNLPPWVNIHACGMNGFFRPLLNTDGNCEEYPANYEYAGSNARCFCRCAGNEPWSQFVRSCLWCLYNAGVSSHTAHIYCYLFADQLFPDGRPNQTLAECYAICTSHNIPRLIDILFPFPRLLNPFPRLRLWP